MYCLADLRNTPVSVFYEQFKKQGLPRAAKPLPIEKNHKMYKRHRRFMRESGPNQIIVMESNNMTLDLRRTLEDLGARITPIYPATPKKNQGALFKTPGGSHVKQVAQNDFSLFMRKTPVTQKLKTPDSNALPRTIKQITQPICFTATREKMEERKDVSRGFSQKQVMGVTSRSVFEAHGINIEPHNARKYHWAHLVAWFLGGNQNSKNLVPSTAAANYNTLNCVENYILQKLVDGKIPRIELQVIPEYIDEEMIPNKITYKISYVDHNGKKEEDSFFIYPQSDTMFSEKSQNTIDVTRDLTVQFNL